MRLMNVSRHQLLNSCNPDYKQVFQKKQVVFDIFFNFDILHKEKPASQHQQAAKPVKSRV